MTGYEILFGGLNFGLIAIVTTKLLRSPNRMLFWSPLLFYTFSWGYYSVLGPAVALLFNNTYDRGRDMRVFLEPALIGGFISYLMTLVGYWFGRRISRRVLIPLRLTALWTQRELGKKLTFFGVTLMIVGLWLFFVAVGTGITGMLNPFALTNAGAGFGGAFTNYFGYGIQLFIPGCILLLLACRRNAAAYYYFVPSLTLTVALYLQQGFRYRLVLLVGGMLIAYYLDRWKRPNAVVQAVSLAGTVMIMGLIGLTREYGKGLDLERLEQYNLFDIFGGGVGDSSIIFTTGAVFRTVPERIPHAWWSPIKGALLMPIPSSIYGGKDTYGYSEALLETIYGDGRSRGSVYMFFGEWYYAYGWPGLIMASLLLGYLMGLLWQWFLKRSDNLYAITLYGCLMPFIYIVISRGYFAQVIMLFCFSAVPIYLIYRINLRKLNGSTAAPRVISEGQVLQPSPSGLPITNPGRR